MNARQKRRGRKPPLERKIEALYRDVLKRFEKVLGNGSTFSTDLARVGYQTLGRRFKGVYPSDRIPRLNDLEPYAIINLDNSSKEGSHWIALALDADDQRLSVYDSFGRESLKIIPSLYEAYGGRIIDSDNDREQRLKEDNCGQRCLAWLLVFDNLGPTAARTV